MNQQTIDWRAEVEKRKAELLAHTRAFLQIQSVLDPKTARAGAPFGEGIAEALEYVLKLCESFGMTTANIDGFAGHAEFGEGAELVGVLTHVDVVPPGDGWTRPPFAGEVVDGKIVARGVVDDKGPTIAAIFAASIVKELALPLKRRVRLIFGADEESEWRCVRRYFATEEMPVYGFSPDGDFPLIYAEKGMFHSIWRQSGAVPANVLERSAQAQAAGASEREADLLVLEGGLRINMVPERAQAVLQGRAQTLQELAERYRRYLAQQGLHGTAELTDDQLTLTLAGVSAHGSDPARGVNAATELIHFLAGVQLDERAAQFIRFADQYLYRQHGGERLGIACDDAEMGPLTLNVGIVRYRADGELVYHLDIRYPYAHPYERWQPILLEHMRRAGLTLEAFEHLPPHRVDPDDPLVRTLQRVYSEQTKAAATLLTMGGATYARSLRKGVAFGPQFPGRADVAHQADEQMELEDLLRATALYAQAIYELANL